MWHRLLLRTMPSTLAIFAFFCLPLSGHALSLKDKRDQLHKELEQLKHRVAAKCSKESVAVDFPKWIGRRSSDLLLKLEIELAEKGRDHLQALLLNCSAPPTTVATTASPWTMPFNGSLTLNDTAFEIQRMEETYIVGNRSIVFLKVRIPKSGRSDSANWCLDYRNLCAHLGRQPIGCHVGYNYINGVQACIRYNVDSLVSDFDCSPNWAIAKYASRVFASENDITHSNTMGFFECSQDDGTSSCHKTAEKSSNALTGITHKSRTVYTVCS